MSSRIDIDLYNKSKHFSKSVIQHQSGKISDVVIPNNQSFINQTKPTDKNNGMDLVSRNISGKFYTQTAEINLLQGVSEEKDKEKNKKISVINISKSENPLVDSLEIDVTTKKKNSLNSPSNLTTQDESGKDSQKSNKPFLKNKK